MKTHLVFEKDVRVEVHRGPGGVLGHPVTVVDVVGHVLDPPLIEKLFVGGISA